MNPLDSMPTTTSISRLLQDLIEEYLDEFREEMEKAANELDEVAGPLRDAPPKKVTIRKPKKKSFLPEKQLSLFQNRQSKKRNRKRWTSRTLPSSSF